MKVPVCHQKATRDEGGETVILRGAADEVRGLAEAVLAQRGVRHGNLHLVPMAQ